MMAFEFDRVAALAKMPRCGCCSNCKLVIWSGEVELKGAASRYVIKPMGPGKTPQLMVRCNWLKSPVEQPDKLQICDGWRDVSAPVSHEKEF